MTITGSFCPAIVHRSDQWDQFGIAQLGASRENGATEHDALAVDEHHMSGLAKPNRVDRRSKKLIGVIDSMEDANRLIAKAVHDG